MARILIAEDSDELRELYGAVLEVAGYQVDLTADGRRALAAADSGHYDLIVTDIFMPHCDGLELLTTLRRRRSIAPIIAVSAGFRGERDMYLDMASRLGACAVLSKPVSPQALVAAVNSALRNNPRAAPN
jgi:DNA-binding response OmpR family regulator